jgi:NFU1 iron-sulfur cluster scaffold homolog, mitochondrial
MHPEPGSDPSQIRWVLAATCLVASGPVTAAPALSELLADGTLASVTALEDCVLTVAGQDQQWSVIGGRVRTALGTALDRPEEWVVAAFDSDKTVLAAAKRVLAGDFGDYVRSHGGGFSIDGVRNGVLDVRLTGACHGCAAAELSLRVGFERQLKHLCPHARVA